MRTLSKHLTRAIALLALLHTACAEQRSARDQEASAGRTAPQPGAAGGASHCTGTLEDFCGGAKCPATLDQAGPRLCENQQGGSLSVEELAPKHAFASNSCSGKSVVHRGKYGDTQYDFDSSGALIGVTASDETEACSGSRVYGKTCAITSVASEPFCRPSCPAIACVAGVHVLADTPGDAAVYHGARVELCRNQECARTVLSSDIQRDVGGQGVFVQRMSNGWEYSLTLWLSQPEPYLDVAYTLWGPNELPSGDNYRAIITKRDGSILFTFSETITNYEIHEVGAPCIQRCSSKRIDYRPVPSESDAGSP